MSACQWKRAQEPCGVVNYAWNYTRAEMEEMAVACGIPVWDNDRFRSNSELCRDLKVRLTPVVAMLEPPPPPPDVPLPELRRRLFALVQAMGDEPTAAHVAERRALNAQIVQAMARDQSQAAAARRQDAKVESEPDANTPQCVGVDLVSQEPLQYRGPGVVHIYMSGSDSHNARPQCYLRQQLLEAMRVAVPLFEWSTHGTQIEPGTPFRQSVYKLPWNNSLVTGLSFETLYRHDFAEYDAMDLGSRIIGAENHTIGALWGVDARVWHLVPRGHASDPAFAFREDSGVRFVVQRIDNSGNFASWNMRQPESVLLDILTTAPALHRFVSRHMHPDYYGRTIRSAAIVQRFPNVDYTVDPVDTYNAFLNHYSLGFLVRVKAYERYAKFILPDQEAAVLDAVQAARNAVQGAVSRYNDSTTLLEHELAETATEQAWSFMTAALDRYLLTAKEAELPLLTRYFRNRNDLAALVFYDEQFRYQHNERGLVAVAERMETINKPALDLTELLFEPMS